MNVKDKAVTLIVALESSSYTYKKLLDQFQGNRSSSEMFTSRVGHALKKVHGDVVKGTNI